MADKKLNAVSTASDGAYIYAEDASGNQIKISKADLASVVAKSFQKGFLNSSNDFDNILNSGVYYSHYTSIPIHAPADWPGSGMLKVDRFVNGISAIYIQTLFDESGGLVYVRAKWSDQDFGKWHKYATTQVGYK